MDRDVDSDGMFDFPMVITMLVSMILIVCVADKVTFIGLNLVIMWLITQFIIVVPCKLVESYYCI